MWELVQAVSRWALPVMLVGIPFYGYVKGVRVFEAFVEGAQEGFWLAVKILPYLIGILAALYVFRMSGCLDLVVKAAAFLLKPLGVPGEVLPLFLVRPLSGSGALGITAELLRRWGPDSYIGRLASTVQGSTDTTFYVITLYFGSIGIRNTRHTLPIALLGDLTGFLAATLICRALFL